jgi:energy-coupling factor transporter ATP-binding protein EcfA2
MFDSLEDLSTKLAATGYFIDPVMTRIVFLAAKLQKPLLLEGPAGSGKTQLAVSVAQAAGTHIERLQCYRGVTEDKAIGRFDESLQRLYMEFSKGNVGNAGDSELMSLNATSRIIVSVPADTKIYVVFTKHEESQTGLHRVAGQ